MIPGTRILATALILIAPAFADDPKPAADRADAWIQDFAKAQEKARTEKKDLLIDFTGSDWCVWCKKLDSEVFTAGEFEAKIQESFVLVKLDFPQDKSLVTLEIEKQNAGLQGRYGVQGFPTIFLADAAGKPYAKTGYQAGGPDAYLTHVGELRGNKAKYAEAIDAAGKLEGKVKAVALDAALALLNDEILLPFYETVVKEILTLDASGEAGLKEKYDELMAAYAERLVQNEFSEAIMPFANKQDWEGMLKSLDGLVAKYKPTNVPMAQQAYMVKAQVLAQHLKKYSEALAAVDAAKELAPDSQMGKQAEPFKAQIKALEAAAAENPEEDDGSNGKDGGGN